MSNKWLFFPSPAADTNPYGTRIVSCERWRTISNSGVLETLGQGTLIQGPWPTIYDQWGQTISMVADRSQGYISWSNSSGRIAFMNANTGAQGLLVIHRGTNGTVSDPAKYYLGIGTYASLLWNGQRATLVPTKKFIGEKPAGGYNTTNPSDLLALNTIDLQMAATVTSIQGTPTSAAYTGAMGTTTTGSLPTGLASVQHRGGYGLRFIFGSEAQRNTFVGNYPSGVGTWYSGVGDSLAFTKSGWAWNLSVSSSSADIQSPPSNSSNFELWHANGVYAVGDDVQIIHTA